MAMPGLVHGSPGKPAYASSHRFAMQPLADLVVLLSLGTHANAGIHLPRY